MADTRQPELSMARFEALVAAYGSDLERFPAGERAAAKALVLRSPEARRMLEAARAFDRLLAAAREEHDTVELEAALASIPRRHTQIRAGLVVLPFRSRARAGLAAAAALVLGLFSGQLAPDEGDANDELETVSASLTFADELLDDLVAEEGGTD